MSGMCCMSGSNICIGLLGDADADGKGSGRAMVSRGTDRDGQDRRELGKNMWW